MSEKVQCLGVGCHLHGRDGSLGGGGDALLQHAQVSGQCRLIPHSGWDSAQQRGHF